MQLLVTAGNTQAPVDQVRCLTNIFTGKTGTTIALAAHARGHTVTLLTSHPEAIADLNIEQSDLASRWTVCKYRTFADLGGLMRSHIMETPPDVVIHSAAVSDYLVDGVYAPAAGTRWTPEGRWLAEDGQPALLDRSAGKVKSDEAELWLRLVRAPKLIDRIRADWSFRGLLVKFKLEVGVDERRLLEIAERSRQHSRADLMVANTLAGAADYAFLGPLQGVYTRVSRSELAAKLLDALARAGEGSRG